MSCPNSYFRRPGVHSEFFIGKGGGADPEAMFMFDLKNVL
jgi:hypothetical protein